MASQDPDAEAPGLGAAAQTMVLVVPRDATMCPGRSLLWGGGRRSADGSARPSVGGSPLPRLALCGHAVASPPMPRLVQETPWCEPERAISSTVSLAHPGCDALPRRLMRERIWRTQVRLLEAYASP
ncbi:MAG TPA: hypothetical protein VI542_24760 [Candidatus Tectomicrobia bacterium]